MPCCPQVSYSTSLLSAQSLTVLHFISYHATFAYHMNGWAYDFKDLRLFQSGLIFFLRVLMNVGRGDLTAHLENKAADFQSTDWTGIEVGNLKITHRSANKLWLAWVRNSLHPSLQTSVFLYAGTTNTSYLCFPLTVGHCHEHAQHMCLVHVLLASAQHERLSWCPNLLWPLVFTHVLP